MDIRADRIDDGLYYMNLVHDGTFGKVLTGWQKIEGSWYYFEVRHNGFYGRGYRDGWFSISGKTYYFDADGKLAVNTVVDGYQVDANGVRGQKVG